MLIDTHAHLEQIDDLSGALKRAKKAGVNAVIAAGTSLKSSQAILKLSEEHKDPIIYPAIGIHPGDLDDKGFSDVLKLIEDNISRIAAIGETGLDYWYKPARKDGPGRRLQKEAFSAQLDIAAKYGKPIIIHSRGAWRDCLEMTVDKGIKNALFHWYSGPEDILKEILGAGYIISATPSSEYSPEHRRAIELTPTERLILETDSPVTYKPPSGKYESEPKDVVRVLKAVSALKDIEEPLLAKQTAKTAINFFNLT